MMSSDAWLDRSAFSPDENISSSNKVADMRVSGLWCCGFAAIVAAATGSSTHCAQPNALVANGSFEEGRNEPLGWSRTTTGIWGSDTAHQGQRFARVDAADERGWESNVVPL